MLCKKTNRNPAIQREMHKDDPRVLFFIDCYEYIEPAIPIFKRIQNHCLQLVEYRLGHGHCMGIAKACELED